MNHEITVRLTDDEYNELKSEAAQNGLELEELIQDLLDEAILSLKPPTIKLSNPPTRREISELFYTSGLIEHIPSGEPLSAEEEAELERLGQLFSQGKPLSEMIIEDRGPY